MVFIISFSLLSSSQLRSALIAAVFREEQAHPVPHIQELFLQTDQKIIHKKSILKPGLTVETVPEAELPSCLINGKKFPTLKLKLIINGK